MLDLLTDPNAWLAFVTLTVLEIVLGIDNLVFISIVAGKLPEDQQPRARFVGLALAVITRLLLLFSISWLTSLEEPLFTVFEHAISVRDIILLVGGLFLLAKATFEIHKMIEGEEHGSEAKGRATFSGVIIQIVILDLVFSIDSVITAIGMADDIAIMAAAVIVAIGFMMWFAKPVSEFVQRHPTVKMLALSFLLLIGVALVADGLSFHIPKGYIYFAMAFSFIVEVLNMKVRPKKSPTAP